MPFTDLYSLFDNAVFSLPYIETDDSKSYLYHFNQRMSLFLNELKTVPQSAIDSIDRDRLFSYVEHINKELEEVLRLYLNGFPSQSYLTFKKLADLTYLNSRLTNWRIISIDSNSQLYRTKREYSTINKNSSGFINYLEPLDLFHVPFEKRKAIGTNRFSIPGFPCVYFSDTLLTSWSEAIDDKNNFFHAACFRNHRPLYIVDLVPINLSKPPTAQYDYLGKLYNYNDVNDAFIDYTILYPIITACHSKISYKSSYNGEVKFKSEYIIPQLLLQWYRDNHIVVDGLRYLSCTAERKFPTEEFKKFNYVIPAIEMKEEGYCSSLLYNFSVSSVYSHLETTADSEIDLLKSITTKLDSATFTPLYFKS